jgi:hypothetical protein
MDISKITDYLYLSSRLQPGHAEELAARNIGLVISMIGGQRPPEIFARPPFRLLWLQTCDSIFIPIPMQDLLKGVQTAVPVIQSGQSILVYCAKGRHRSVVMSAAILIAMNYTAHEAAEFLRKQRLAADPQAWHISRRIYKFEESWRNKNNPPNSQATDMEETYAEIATRLACAVLLFTADAGQWAFGKIQNRKVNSI